MPAKKYAIDRDKLRAAIRRLGNEYVYYMLDDAIELLPPSKLAKLAGQYLDVKSLASAPKVERSLLAHVKYDRDKHLTAAARKASAAQRKALAEKTDWRSHKTRKRQ